MQLSRVIGKIERLFTPSHPLIEVGISKENLLHNLHTYQKAYPELTFAPVLKSNAYGHGLAVIARLLDREDIAFLMVDSLYEARTLRSSGIRSRILVLGYVRPEDIAENRLRDIDFGITDIEQLRDVAQHTKQQTRIHLKIDTGMHRQGIVPADVVTAIELIKSNANLQLVGVCTHLADADGADPKNTDQQIDVWNETIPNILLEFPSIEYRHVSATKGVAWSKVAHTNVGRLGIGLYGFDTAHESHTPLKPVLEVRTLITSMREVPPGDFVGYNATYTPKKPVRIATVPVGYFEGIDRLLSNKGSMLVNNKKAPIAGRVSMNMCSLDVTNIPDASRGDEVIAISRNPNDENSVQHIAELLRTEPATTPYVILVHIPPHLKRVVE